MSKMNDLLQIIYKVYFENNTKSKKYYIKIKKHSIKYKPINKQHTLIILTNVLTLKNSYNIKIQK